MSLSWRPLPPAPPDLILLDWQMPSADGMEVTRRLRSEPDPALRDVPVVLITAQSGPENTAAGFAGGVTDYLTKPFRPAHVRARACGMRGPRWRKDASLSIFLT
jgi:cyclic di-GMP phosphodiesterase